MKILVIVLATIWGCENSATTPEDTVPPARVVDLAVTAVTDHSATVQWSAPGDDGNRGRAWQYDLRYDTRDIRSTWETATRVDSLPRPLAGGTQESVVIDSLTAEVLYYFALRTADEAGNWSPEISNVASARVSADTIPPAAISDLAVTTVTHESVTLTWTAPGDNGFVGQAAIYEIRYSRDVLSEENWDQATEVADPPMPGPAGTVEAAEVIGLVDATEYHFGIKAEDEAINWSPLSNVATITTLPDTIPPGTVSDLAVVAATYSSITLEWTAPGDDRTDGRATTYDVRYAKRPIHARTWDEATKATFPPTPSASGEPDRLTILLLEPAGLYYFALRAADERGNWSGISNDPKGSPRVRAGRTWRVSPDGTGDALTVQAGIEMAADGDVVLVGPGTYFENINMRGKAIHLLAEPGPEVTILDGSKDAGSIVTCDSGEGNDTVIEGFTITHGKGRVDGSGGRHGAGIYCKGSSPIIRGNVVSENRAESPPGYIQSWGGGLIFSGNAQPLIVKDCLFEANLATSNGGAIWAEGPCVVEGNAFTGNTTVRGDGAALYVARTFGGLFRYNLFKANIAGDHGGGVFITNVETGAVPAPEIEVCWNTILFNEAGTIAPDCAGGGIYLNGGAYIHHNTIAFNASASVNFPSGGGICLVNSTAGTVVENNLIYRNREGAVVAFKYSGPQAEALIRRNLVFHNGRVEIYNRYEPEFHFALAENILLEPMFCTFGPEGRGEVAGASPALNQPFGTIGAVDQPGCGPYIESEQGEPSVWGTKTMRY